MMIGFLLGVPGQLKTLLDRLTSTWAGKLDSLRTDASATRLSNLDGLTAARSTLLDNLNPLLASSVGKFHCQVFTATGLFYPKPGMTAAWVLLVGAGGGAGAGNRVGYVGGGGGGGEVKLLPVPCSYSPINVVIGAAGAGGVSYTSSPGQWQIGNSGASGGNTYFQASDGSVNVFALGGSGGSGGYYNLGGGSRNGDGGSGGGAYSLSHYNAMKNDAGNGFVFGVGGTWSSNPVAYPAGVSGQPGPFGCSGGGGGVAGYPGGFCPSFCNLANNGGSSWGLGSSSGNVCSPNTGGGGSCRSANDDGGAGSAGYAIVFWSE